MPHRWPPTAAARLHAHSHSTLLCLVTVAVIVHPQRPLTTSTPGTSLARTALWSHTPLSSYELSAGHRGVHTHGKAATWALPCSPPLHSTHTQLPPKAASFGGNTDHHG